MKDNILTRWVYQNGFFLTKDSKVPITHLCMDGGKLNIPNRKMLEFFEMYSKSIHEGEKLYICECTTDIVKMYCDFDIVYDTEVSLERICDFGSLCSGIIKTYFMDTYDLVVCTSPSKEVQKNKKKQIKTGVHLVWPELFVTKDCANSLAMQFIKELEHFDSSYKWSDIVDSSVYINGLRMIGSRKITNKKRKLKDRLSSENSIELEEKDYELIKVDENRPYNPSIIIKANGSFERVENIISVKHLTMCSIRTFHNEQALEPIVNIPQCNVKKSRSTKVDTDIEDPDAFKRIEAFIRYQTITQWDSPLRQLKKHNAFYIAKIDSMYCLNVQREHNSCGVYFQITEAGMYQRCFCRCDTTEGRMDGQCSQFKSAPFPLPQEVKKILFPNSTTKKRATKTIPAATTSKEIFGSNRLLKSRDTLDKYLRMSMGTILEIEKACQ